MIARMVSYRNVDVNRMREIIAELQSVIYIDPAFSEYKDLFNELNIILAGGITHEILR